jgi:hypothetical protein
MKPEPVSMYSLYRVEGYKASPALIISTTSASYFLHVGYSLGLSDW